MRALTKTILLGFALLLTVHCSLLTANAQSRTTRIYQRCGSQPLSLSPRTPGQVTIDSTGNIAINPCYQKEVTFKDPHNSTHADLTWSSLTGFSFRAAVYFADSDINYQNIVTITPDVYGGTNPGNWSFYRTITTAGTTGNVTINKIAGTVNIAAGAGTAGVTVTNNLVTANSIVYAIARTNDATCSVKSVVPASGSFVLRTTANCTAETSFGFLVTN